MNPYQVLQLPVGTKFDVIVYDPNLVIIRCFDKREVFATFQIYDYEFHTLLDKLNAIKDKVEDKRVKPT